MDVKPGKLYKLLMNRILWNTDLSIWPTTSPNAPFEVGRLNKDEIVMVVEITDSFILVLHKRIIGRLSTYYDVEDNSFFLEEIMNP